MYVEIVLEMAIPLSTILQLSSLIFNKYLTKSNLVIVFWKALEMSHKNM